MSNKPVISRSKITYDKRIIRLLKASFNDSKRNVLIIDNNYNLDFEVSHNTFSKLCYEVAGTLRKNFTFVYAETNGLDKEQIENLISKFDPVGIMFADYIPFTKVNLDKSKYFYYVREWQGIPTILSTPLEFWGQEENYNKSEGKKATIGFNLKHLLAVTRGKNAFNIDLSLLNSKARIIWDIEAFDRLMDKLEKIKLICTDIEGISLRVITNRMLTIQIGFWYKGKIVSYVIPWEHKEFTWDKADFKHIKRRLKHLFLRRDLENVFHFAQYDIGQLCHELNMEVFPNLVYDIPSAEFAIDENHKYIQEIYKSSGDWEKGFRPYSLEFCEYRYGIFRPADMVIGKSDRGNMEQFTIEQIADYGGFDVRSPLLIRDAQLQQCTDKYIGHKSVDDYLKLVHHQLGTMTKIFALLKNTGIYINQENAYKLVEPGNVFTKTVKEISARIVETENGKKANALLLKEQGINSVQGPFSTQKAVTFSLGKSHHLKTLYYRIMKLDPVKLGKGGEGSTDKGFQNKYKEQHEEVNLLSHFNKVRTLKGNFADSLIKIIRKDRDFATDGRLRPILGFLEVLTGRLSSNKPNSQNLPTRSDDGFEIHKELVKGIKASFSVAPGRVMLGSDFSAHEVRIAGVLSKDKGVRSTFMKANEAIRKFRLTPDEFVEAAAKVLALEGDVHIINVKFFFKQDVDKDHPLRYKIKAIVFGVLYGKLAKGLAKELKITVEEAQSLIDIMFERWHYLKEWIDATHKEAKDTYMVRYPNLRVAHMWAYLHDDIWAERAMDRRAVNYPIQGFSSDIGCVAIYCYKDWVYKYITRKKFKLDAKHINIVHDATYLDVLYEHMPFAIYLQEHAMSTLPMNFYKENFNYEISTPLGYGMEFGKDWASLKEWNFRLKGFEKDGKDKKTGQPIRQYVPGLLDMLRDEGKRLDKPHDKVIKDVKFMMDIRHKELNKDPYHMLVTDKTIDRVFEGLHMFKDQVK